MPSFWSWCYVRGITTYDQLREAILTRQQVVGNYGGHPREFCPYILGSWQGSARCLVYQFGGSSSSGPITPGSPNNWRCLRVEELRIVRLQPGRWYTGPSHERSQRCIDVIDLDVEKPETLVEAAKQYR